MKIGIDASRAFLKKRTGIEEYSYQIIKHLRAQLGDHDIVLYVRKWKSRDVDFELPGKWAVREIPYVYGWTQVGLALEMLLRPVDLFFSPAHTTAVIHPQRTIVTVHGLEYEHCPQSYSCYARLFHRIFIKRSCRWASKVIAVSKNTKKDLVELYKIDQQKIEVIYNGYIKPQNLEGMSTKREKPYLFYIGRIEQRKNISKIIEAFEIIKRDGRFKGELVLAGVPGHGYQRIKEKIDESNYKNDIKQLGFVSDERKWELLAGAEIFLFPSLCEGFGIPILEAQSAGTAVITSKFGPFDEVAGDQEILVDPRKANSIADKIGHLLENEQARQRAIGKGNENIKRFSWKRSAELTAAVIRETMEDRKT